MIARTAYTLIFGLSIFAFSAPKDQQPLIPDQKRQQPSVADEVQAYLNENTAKFKRGTEEYYALASLDEALKAFREGNYGIGAVVLVKWQGKIYEYRGRNAMVSGYGLRDHAEARALDTAAVLIAELEGHAVSELERLRMGKPKVADAIYPADTEYSRKLPDGIHVFGTLEPCPMCMVMIMNVRAMTSKSLAKDGNLKTVDMVKISDGGAMATEEKFKGAPLVWQSIRQAQGLKFELYQANSKMADLAARIFLETREQIDQSLSQKKKRKGDR